VLLLALAITGLVTIFAPLQAIVLAPLPFPRPDELVVVDAPVLDFYTDSFPRRESLSPVLRNVAAYRNDVSLITLSPEIRRTLRTTVTSVTREFFATLDTPPIRGRDFAPSDFAQYFQDHAPVDAAVAIVSYEFWRTKLSEIQDLRKADLTIGAARYNVIGVAPPRLGFPSSTEIWVPTRAPFAVRGEWTIVGRLQPGLSPALATDNLRTIVDRTPGLAESPQLRRATVQSLRVYLLGDRRSPLVTLWWAAVLFFVLACGGVANILWAQGVGRRYEMAIRMALGAPRSRLVARLVFETAVLASLGTLIGVCLSVLGLRVLESTLPSITQQHTRLISANGVAMVLAASLVATVLCGLGPALGATSAGPLTAVRRDQGRFRSTIFLRRGAVSPVLAGGQLALAMVLLVCTVLLLRSLFAALRVPLGFDPSNVIVLHVDLPPSAARYETSQNLYRARRSQNGTKASDAKLATLSSAVEEAIAADYAQHVAWYGPTLDAIRATPGVVEVGCLFPTPFMPGGDRFRTIVPIDPIDGSYRDRQLGFVRTAGQQTFRALGMHLRAGRTILPEELVPPRPVRYKASDGKPDVAVVNETLARRLWPNQTPIGKELLVGYRVVVVGVVADIHESLKLRDVPPTVYVPAFPESGAWSFVIKIGADISAAAIALTLRDALTARIPALPRPTVVLLPDQVAEPLRSLRFALYLLACFAAAGTLVAGVGVYAMSAEVSASRIHEVGVRLALGAAPNQIRRLALWRGFKVVLLAIPVGTFGAWAAAQGFSHSLVHVEHLDVVSLSVCSALLMVVALVASLPCAFRAANVDAAVALRADT
jgi:hypothetical protein